MKMSCLLTCPQCGYQSLELMSADHSEEFHECDQCHQTFMPEPGDCCVYRSYGDTPCACSEHARESAQAAAMKVA